MAYRNGTYIAFHANDTTEPTESDIKYYNLLKAWDSHSNHEFSIINSHDKTAAVRDSSKRETLRQRLVTRLNNSKNMLLIIGRTTKEDRDWVPFEIEYSVDKCSIPIIAAYTTTDRPVLNPSSLSSLWPGALSQRINNGSAGVIHIPFKQQPIMSAIDQFSHNNMPKGKGLGWYTKETYQSWGIR